MRTVCRQRAPRTQSEPPPTQDPYEAAARHPGAPPFAPAHAATALASRPCRLLLLEAEDLRRFGRKLRAPLAAAARARREFLGARRRLLGGAAEGARAAAAGLRRAAVGPTGGGAADADAAVAALLLGGARGGAPAEAAAGAGEADALTPWDVRGMRRLVPPRQDASLVELAAFGRPFPGSLLSATEAPAAGWPAAAGGQGSSSGAGAGAGAWEWAPGRGSASGGDGGGAASAGGARGTGERGQRAAAASAAEWREFPPVGMEGVSAPDTFRSAPSNSTAGNSPRSTRPPPAGDGAPAPGAPRPRAGQLGRAAAQAAAQLAAPQGQEARRVGSFGARRWVLGPCGCRALAVAVAVAVRPRQGLMACLYGGRSVILFACKPKHVYTAQHPWGWPHRARHRRAVLGGGFAMPHGAKRLADTGAAQ